MDIRLIYIADCANRQEAESNLRAALAELGDHDSVVVRQLIDTVEDAERLGFLGSPTFRVDGRDPFADPDATAGLSCRLYRTEAGLAGSPSVAQLVEALAAHGDLRAPPDDVSPVNDC